jgi:hypothetical protein
MSAPLDPESIPKELKDGVVAAVIGAFSMAARLLLSEENYYHTPVMKKLRHWQKKSIF